MGSTEQVGTHGWASTAALAAIASGSRGDRRLVAQWRAGTLAVERDPLGQGFDPGATDVLKAAGAVLTAGWSQLTGGRERLAAARLETERLREEAQETSDLEAMKTRLLNLAAHELRGPLAVLRGYISMLADGSLDLAMLRRITPILLGKAAQMDALVTQMLDVARYDAGVLEMRMEVVDLGLLAREAVEVASLLSPQGIALSFEHPPEPVLVLGDRLRLSVIVSNLIDNAVKYSPGGGQVRCILHSEAGRAYFRVRDRGLGISAADMPMLFTRFGRIVTPENSHISGTGLGLYLGREIAHHHGGDLEVTSEPGAGSEFTLWLPTAG